MKQILPIHVQKASPLQRVLETLLRRKKLPEMVLIRKEPPEVMHLLAIVRPLRTKWSNLYPPLRRMGE
jgi:hypothetical protein